MEVDCASPIFIVPCMSLLLTAHLVAESAYAQIISDVRCLVALAESPILSADCEDAIGAYTVLFTYCRKRRSAETEGCPSEAEFLNATAKIVLLVESLGEQNNTFIKVVGLLLRFPIVHMAETLNIFEKATKEVEIQAKQEDLVTTQPRNDDHDGVGEAGGDSDSELI